jgi:hypothetical protein
MDVLEILVLFMIMSYCAWCTAENLLCAVGNAAIRL